MYLRDHLAWSLESGGGKQVWSVLKITTRLSIMSSISLIDITTFSSQCNYRDKYSSHSYIELGKQRLWEVGISLPGAQSFCNWGRGLTSPSLIPQPDYFNYPMLPTTQGQTFLRWSGESPDYTQVWAPSTEELQPHYSYIWTHHIYHSLRHVTKSILKENTC